MTQDDLLGHAERSIAVGSKSFAAASRLFDPGTRRSAVLLYAWCRHCDDVIDGQEAGHGAVVIEQAEAQRRLAELRRQTDVALSAGQLDDPAFAALREVARRHDFAPQEPFDLLEGFDQDVRAQRYQTLDDLLGYCYHVAGVVGLMMARVMGVRDAAVLDRACDLGLAMQLTNIARDIVEDAAVSRCYVPEQWLQREGIAADQMDSPAQRQALARVAEALVAAAEPYYASAEAGLAALPWRSAWAVATAAQVYRGIGLKVRARGSRAWDTRCSTSKGEKLLAVATGLWRALSARWRRHPPRDSALWQRPQHDASKGRPGAPEAALAAAR
ncbi:phytoene/squalene synthase family protein [Pseudomonas sp. S75]|uniref:phytoene/squalene synthase family protein n=1 Tax=unclassified Pseudomonas TaxID=196821 RepID=UPI001902CA9A|nr:MULTISPECIES: phytoene/squalene synthase family protein [unclassified Pseudomonas]MBJ9975912.1 phytoene/squalene synthase family protein [Pseudomonas sp. S30]MBK0154652.1 phytoene/squalene synthase family protein [Pseudomonas sp. S75]